MAEVGGEVDTPPAKVRVVRCPKCQKLLPELAGFSVYRCGGCSATLQAFEPKREESVVVGSPGKCEEQRERRSFREAPICLFHREEEDGNPSNVVVVSPIASACELEEKLDANMGYPSSSMADVSNLVRKNGCSDEESSHCEGQGSCAAVDGGEVKGGTGEEGRGKGVQVEGAGSGMYQKKKKKQQLQQVRQNGVFEHQNGEILEGMQSTPRAASPSRGGVGIPRNSDEGHSNCPPKRIRNDFGGGDRFPYGNSGLPNRVKTLEHDRMELLKKLDELREQLSQSCKVADASDDRAPTTNVGHQQRLDFGGLRYQNRRFCGGLSSCCSYANDHTLHLQSHGPSWHSQDEIPFGCGSSMMMPFGSRMSKGGGAPYEPYNFCQQRGSPNLSSGQFDQDLMAPHPRGAAHYHQPTCSCSHFCNQQWQAPSHLPTSTLLDRGGPPYHANDNGPYPLNGSLSLDSDNRNRGRAINSSIISNNPPPLSCQGLLPFGGNFNRRDCGTLAGGAPFVVCPVCSELLEVAHKRALMGGGGRCKLRCGSCSQVISVELDKDGLVVRTPVMGTTNLPSNGVGDGAILGAAPDYHGPGFNSRSVQGSRVRLPSKSPPFSLSTTHGMMMEKEEEGVNLVEAENMEGRSSSSTSASRDEASPDAAVIAPTSRELQKPEPNSRATGLPLREHFGYSPTTVTANRTGMGNRSKRSSDQDKTRNFKQNSVKDVAVATEMDLAVDEYPNPRLSEDSDEASKEDDLPRTTKGGGDSFFTGLIKKGFKDLSRSNQHSENRKSKVSINGHLLPDRIIKKAEKLAGPIQSGEYWYDYHAGFWGVMGQHCLGIIPPFIEELNYPMPRNCAGGNTGVLVNGRELQEKDLDLLASRGLPTTKDRSYIIDISGKVSDANSGEELDGLGKLAPTVEKMKHGFGMRVLKESSD